MQLFYQPLLTEHHYLLNTEESRHCIKVLRKKETDIITIVDGKGKFYEARITDANAKACAFAVVNTWEEIQKNFRIHIGIAPTKNSDRLEWFIEKAVEIGIDEISLLICDHSERKNLKTDRLKRKAISAMKQSVKATLPPIHEPVAYAKFLKQAQAAPHKFLAYVSDTPIPHLLHAALPAQPYTILIGPEGDFSPSEIEQAHQANFQTVSLGHSRLRTETAGMAACHILNLVNC